MPGWDIAHFKCREAVLTIAFELYCVVVYWVYALDNAPTADLESDRPGLTDEEALGLSYEQIDDFLEGKPVTQQVEQTLSAIYQRTQHKRQPIPTIYD